MQVYLYCISKKTNNNFSDYKQFERFWHRCGHLVIIHSLCHSGFSLGLFLLSLSLFYSRTEFADHQPAHVLKVIGDVNFGKVQQTKPTLIQARGLRLMPLSCTINVYFVTYFFGWWWFAAGNTSARVHWGSSWWESAAAWWHWKVINKWNVQCECAKTFVFYQLDSLTDQRK